MAKDFRAKAEEDMKSEKMASLLLLLSCGGQKAERMNRTMRTSDRVFKCKTCDRRFPTFQALGGHVTSHKRPSAVRGARHDRMQSLGTKPRVHGCPICGLEFMMGQALGGHMRRHKPAVGATLQAHSEKKDGEGKVWPLDLNLPPLEGETELQNLGFGVGLIQEVPMIDFLGCSE